MKYSVLYVDQDPCSYNNPITFENLTNFQHGILDGLNSLYNLDFCYNLLSQEIMYKLEHKTYHVLITHFQMDLNGNDRIRLYDKAICRLKRITSLYPQLKVILLTGAYLTPEEYKTTGAHAYLHKVVKTEDNVNEIRQLIQGFSKDFHELNMHTNPSVSKDGNYSEEKDLKLLIEEVLKDIIPAGTIYPFSNKPVNIIIRKLDLEKLTVDLHLGQCLYVEGSHWGTIIIEKMQKRIPKLKNIGISFTEI